MFHRLFDRSKFPCCSAFKWLSYIGISTKPLIKVASVTDLANVWLALSIMNIDIADRVRFNEMPLGGFLKEFKQASNCALLALLKSTTLERNAAGFYKCSTTAFSEFEMRRAIDADNRLFHARYSCSSFTLVGLSRIQP